ncbi:hypothetical protein ACFL5K_03265 [Gemmatimonadota bacterium]
MREAKYPIPFSLNLSEKSYSTVRKRSDEKKVSMADIVREKIDEFQTDTIDDDKNETSEDRIFDLLSDTEKKKEEELDF